MLPSAKARQGPRLIYNVATEIAAHLEYLFNSSLSSEVVPDRLKIAKIIPIYWKGSKFTPLNYRPISLFNIFNKELEKIIYKKLYLFLNTKHKIISPYQFGLRQGHSSTLSFIAVMDKMYERLDEGNIALGIYIDIQKAFDCVNYRILLDKLNNYGIRGIPLKWIENYLIERKQFVYVNETKSCMMNIAYGVPQGSVIRIRAIAFHSLYVLMICNFLGIMSTWIYLQMTQGISRLIVI